MNQILILNNQYKPINKERKIYYYYYYYYNNANNDDDVEDTDIDDDWIHQGLGFPL